MPLVAVPVLSVTSFSTTFPLSFHAVQILLLEGLPYWEMYQDIVTELGNRKRAKEKEIAILKTQCQTEAVRIRIPETYELQKEMQQSRRQIEEGQTAGLADFMDRLGTLCNWMKKELEIAESAYKEVECARTSKGEELAKAEELLKWFVQFEKGRGRTAKI